MENQSREPKKEKIKWREPKIGEQRKCEETNGKSLY